MVITQESARSLAALKRPVAADVRTPREQQDEPLVLPARSPNLNAYAERWVRSVKEECPSKVILFGERSLRRALSEYVEHFHAERNHQAQSFAHVTRFCRRRARLSEQSRNRSMSHYPARPGGCAGRKISANCKWVGRSPARSLPKPYLASITLHQTARAGGTQVRAQFFGTRAALRPDVDPRPAHAAAREPMVNDAWFAARQDGRVLLLQLAIGGERRRVGRASDQFHAPGIGRFGYGRRRTSEKASDLPTRHGVCNVHLGRARLNSGPLLGGLAGHEGHIGARLARQAAPAGEPVAHPPGPGIVGGCREAEISELASQVAQELRGFGDRFDGVEGVGKTAPARGRRHELRHALRAGAAHRRRVEAALLPDQPGEEIDRQIIFRRRRREGLTDAVDSGRNARWRRGPGTGRFRPDGFRRVH